MSSSQSQKVVVIGGGPVGALAALYAARRGYQTELYELRDDPNHGDPSLRPDFAVIPLALSQRGIEAIEEAGVSGLLEGILENSRDIFTRMIHTENSKGEPELIPMVYGPNGECLHTLQREKVTQHCLMALEKEPTAKLFFNHKTVSIDLDNKKLKFENVVWRERHRIAEQQIVDDINKPMPIAKPSEEVNNNHKAPVHKSGDAKPDETQIKEVKYDFLIGADGTYSSVRQTLMRKMEIDFHQTYVQAHWCDFIIPSAKNGDYPMDSRCLHVWPADKSIVMAQPDFNNTFRAGMVCDTEQIRHFEAHPEQFADWFRKEFKGIVPDLMSAEEATAQFVKHQKIPLKSIKLNKFGYKDDVVLLGDSSHTMTPFHAMGMITGLEDVRVFFKRFRDPAAAAVAANRPTAKKGPTPFCPAGTIAAYTAHRMPDVNAMVDLAHEHYGELRHGVRSPVQRARKIFDAAVRRHLPFTGWNTLYARIQFGTERMSEVVQKERKQTNIVKGMLSSTGMLVGGVAYACVNLLLSQQSQAAGGASGILEGAFQNGTAASAAIGAA
ncbi:kynurenine 3-monooxygenase [Xylariaceae sp. FL0016]|nr:kynurenine 3-monooxygenase [Xylariaceae sp. FL0016]